MRISFNNTVKDILYVLHKVCSIPDALSVGKVFCSSDTVTGQAVADW
jgi:hypothetical protein